jgi:hypothetical protein
MVKCGWVGPFHMFLLRDDIISESGVHTLFVSSWSVRSCVVAVEVGCNRHGMFHACTDRWHAYTSS